MISRKMYQKHFMLASALLLFFVMLGIFLSSFLMKYVTAGREIPPPIFFARIIDRINPTDKAEALKEVASWQDDFPAPEMLLLNESGQVLFPEGKKEILNWGKLNKPSLPYDFIYVSSEGSDSALAFGPPFPHMPDALVKLQGMPDRYLFIRAPELPQLMGNNSKIIFPLIGLGSLVISLLLGVGTTITIIYSGVKKGVSQADDVISEIHKGNLKARFSIHRKDEFGKAMMRFNFMADEIEKLVLNLREVDHARTRLLQELAHDLRTPIASLKNLMETLHTKRQKFTIEIQDEMAELSLKEIYYFERLVEDLLFLAQIKEPSLQVQFPPIDISSALQETADDVWTRYQHQEKQIALNQRILKEPLKVHCDHHLITRLFRNALENAFSFANSQVLISTRLNEEGKIEILIEDDGPGFGNDTLSTFGTRRVTRKLDNKPNGRLSVGLGSVVMKTIVEALGGQMKASNRLSGDKILGAKVEIILPWKI